MPGGRPTIYSEKLARTICERVASGRTLLDVSRDEDIPERGTIYRWRFEKDEFNDMYTRARHCLVEQWVDEVIEISDDNSRDTRYYDSDDNLVDNPDDAAYEKTDHDHINRARLRCDSRKWVAAKVIPKLYSDKQTVTHEAPSGFNFVMNPPKDK